MTDEKRFFIEGHDACDEMYHYRASGLDNVYLLNGFEKKETAYGPGVSIRNVESLHRAIGLALVYEHRPLSPRELRFLRKQMGFTQQDIADRLRIDAQTIARYEKEQSAVPGAVDQMIRFIFVLYHMPAEEREVLFEELKEQMEQDDDTAETSQPLRFRETNCGWESQHCH